jgi:hypothetical protein
MDDRHLLRGFLIGLGAGFTTCMVFLWAIGTFGGQ